MAALQVFASRMKTSMRHLLYALRVKALTPPHAKKKTWLKYILVYLKEKPRDLQYRLLF
jgi:hypothetical protein